MTAEGIHGWEIKHLERVKEARLADELTKLRQLGGVERVVVRWSKSK